MLCFSLSSLSSKVELTGGQHLLLCILLRIKEQEVVIGLLKKKTKKQLCKAHVAFFRGLYNSWCLGIWGDESFKPDTNLPPPPSHLRWKGRGTEPDHLDSSVGAEACREDRTATMLSTKQSKTTCSVVLPRTHSSTAISWFYINEHLQWLTLISSLHTRKKTKLNRVML